MMARAGQVDAADHTPWPEGVARDYVRAGYWWGKSLLDILERACARTPGALALVAEERSFTFAQLDAASTLLASELRHQGLGQGDEAVVQLPDGAAYYVAFWALLKLDVRAVYALPKHGSYELEAFCGQLEPALLLLSRRHVSPGTGARAGATAAVGASRAASVKHVLYFEDLGVLESTAWGGPHVETGAQTAIEAGVGAGAKAEGRAPFPASRASDVAFFQLSGGSTNTPKLIPRTHDDYYYSVRRSAEICELDDRSVYLCALPAAHNFPLSSPGALGTWHAGGAVVVASDPSPSTCFPLIARHGVTFTSLVPPLIPLWLDAAREAPQALATLSFLQVGGAKLPVVVAKRIEPELGCRLQQVFGMAEGLVCYTRLDDDDWHRHNTQGRPMSDADEVRIVDEQGRPVAPGEPGRLMTRGPYTIRGYHRAEEHNRAVFDAEGFYLTGDVVARTESGHLVVLGREKDQINRGGEKIAAEEVENLLLTYPGLTHAAIVAVPDDTLGERSLAAIVCEGEPPKAHLLRKHLREAGLSEYKFPDHFVALDSLPTTAVGKPDKKRLRAELGRTIEPRGRARGDTQA